MSSYELSIDAHLINSLLGLRGLVPAKKMFSQALSERRISTSDYLSSINNSTDKKNKI